MAVYLSNVPRYKEKFKNELKKKTVLNENSSKFNLLELGSTRSRTLNIISDAESGLSDNQSVQSMSSQKSYTKSSKKGKRG